MRILVIEDNDDHFDLIEDAIDDIEVDITLARGNTMQAGMAALQDETFDVCLFDLVLPDSTLDESIEIIGRLVGNTPIVALTSIKDMYVAEKLMSHGVQDYLPKDEMTPFSLYRTCLFAMQRQQYLLRIDHHNKDMQAFCASLSHDFFSSINRISQVVGLLESGLSERINLSDEDKLWFEFLNRSTEEIRHLVSGLRQYLSVNSEATITESVNIGELIVSVENLLRETIDNEFELTVVNTKFIVSGFSSLLFILLQNLLSNGIKYSDGTAKLCVLCEQHEHMLTVQVSDCGIGFDAKEAQEIFKPFNRLNTERGGSGLGLSICLRIVELHNGKIYAESSPGNGSTFTVELPLIQ